ncbi:restriction endonuclease subunit S [Vibrio cholerae]|uniref:restriction endonuclease subunit S n=1 Tax=Vibrio cholerae TaxID=666 RepID=UPI00019F727F|nr:restriction endonuclease subunit S [Vibrio cholerae]EEO15169.1 type I restriction-modification system specificity subunit S [Vibrio cholerae TMA 21]EGQ9854456.1 restriction endonuclease subunit S [Vibrio cholerae]EGZ6883008.1 restriction endonuclease subunit S [Vibrio cholerae]EKI0759252.1 restriction endonuclease subunit S [Vibrio cholerae]HAS3151370.1 restriction endonuclease subunit S [Vibrio cholerae]
MNLLTPKLRFNEFSNGWPRCTLKDTFTIHYGKDHKLLSDGIYPLLGSGGVMRYVSSYLYDKPSVLIGRKGTIDKPQFISTPFWTVDTLFYTEIKNNFVPYFVYLLSLRIRWKKYSEATGVPSLNVTSIYGIQINVPSVEEQQKIANFLTTVDTKINQLTEKHRLLKEYKKGVMQQLFSQKIRFKDEGHKAFPDWTQERLDYFIERISDPVSVDSQTEYREIGIRSHGKGIFHKESTTGDDIGNKRVFWVKPNALVLNIVFAWERAVAVTSNNENGFIASHRFPMYIPKANRADVNYLLYFFLSPKGEALLNLASPGGAGRNKTLGQSEFMKLKVRLPSQQEQQKIAQFLQALDSKITAVSEQIEQTKQFKKGLLQQMFV